MNLAERAKLRPYLAAHPEALEALTSRQAAVAAMLCGTGQFEGHPLTLDQAAQRLDLTRERIRQIGRVAASRLRHPAARAS